MTLWTLLAGAWRPEPTVIGGCAALLLAYGAVVLPHSRGAARPLLFLVAVATVLIALISPLDVLSDTYLFSAHMIQHLLLVLVVPPLLLLALPPWLLDQVLSWRPARWAEVLLGRPLVGWSLGVGTVWIWHLPALYNAALSHPGVHLGQHLSFLVTAAIFWWPVAAPAAWRRHSPLGALLYLFTAAAANVILGVLLTFAPAGLYPLYQHPVDTLGLLRELREGWGLTPAVDQQVGGLLMWMATAPVYLCAVLATVVRWFREPELEPLRRPHAA